MIKVLFVCWGNIQVFSWKASIDRVKQILKRLFIPKLYQLEEAVSVGINSKPLHIFMDYML